MPPLTPIVFLPCVLGVVFGAMLVELTWLSESHVVATAGPLALRAGIFAAFMWSGAYLGLILTCSRSTHWQIAGPVQALSEPTASVWAGAIAAAAAVTAVVALNGRNSSELAHHHVMLRQVLRAVRRAPDVRKLLGERPEAVLDTVRGWMNALRSAAESLEGVARLGQSDTVVSELRDLAENAAADLEAVVVKQPGCLLVRKPDRETLRAILRTDAGEAPTSLQKLHACYYNRGCRRIASR